jgi:IPT/TIG domain-containing protein
VLTSTAGYAGGGTGFRPNTSSFSPGVVQQYCNGSKRPPEAGATGWFNVPPGTNESNVPIPVFSLTAGATVDEGNNWVNISWGPLSMNNPSTGAVLGDYSLAAGSPAIGYITSANSSTTYAAAPLDDFFGNLRKSNNSVDAGAVEFGGNTAAAPTLTSIVPNAARRGQAVSVTLTGTNLTGATGIAVSGTLLNAIAVSNLVVVNDTTITATFTIGASASASAHLVVVNTPGGTSNSVTFTVQLPTVASITPTSGSRGTSVPVTITGTGLNGATSVTAGSGVTATITSIDPAGTSLNATFAVSAGAGLTTRNVRVVTPGGTTASNAAVTFTVTP